MNRPKLVFTLLAVLVLGIVVGLAVGFFLSPKGKLNPTGSERLDTLNSGIQENTILGSVNYTNDESPAYWTGWNEAKIVLSKIILREKSDQQNELIISFKVNAGGGGFCSRSIADTMRLVLNDEGDLGAANEVSQDCAQPYTSLMDQKVSFLVPRSQRSFDISLMNLGSVYGVMPFTSWHIIVTSHGDVTFSAQLKENSEEGPKDQEKEQAQETLLNFFNYVASDDFKNAVKIFYPLDENDKYNWDMITQYRDPEKQNSSKEEELAYYCSAVGTCLRAELLGFGKRAENDYIFTIQFREKDGSKYIFGPCCGATEEDEPSRTQFEYEVKKIDGDYKVVTPPLYRP